MTMIPTTELPPVRIPLGDGDYIDVDIRLLAGTVVPKPRPKQLADLVISVGDPADLGAEPARLSIRLSISDRP